MAIKMLFIYNFSSKSWFWQILALYLQSEYQSFIVMKTKSMQIKFDGNTHQIDANTLINYLIHYNAVVSVANQVLGQGEKEVAVKVNALEKGSFIIDLSLCEETLKTLFSRENIDYLAGLVTVVGGIWAAYKYFKGHPAKKNEEINKFNATFNDSSHNTNITINNTIINVYNQRDVREAINKSIETADQDENVDGVRIVSDETKDIVIDRSEFSDLEYDGFDQEEEMPQTIEETVDATLTIISLNFEKSYRWQFMYNGFKISMVVKDDALMKRIDEGDRFGKGDSIKVKMLIVKEYNKSYHAYENKRYKIIEFYDHVIPPKQGELFN